MDLDGMSALNLFSRVATFVPTDPRRKGLINRLPAVSEADLLALNEKDSCCPICFTPFLAILASEEMALAMDSPAHSAQDLGVTRLIETCGHLFCRKDITTWIRQQDTCPTCRQPFFTTSAPSIDFGTLQSNPRQSPDENYTVLRAADAALMLWNEDWEMHRSTASGVPESTSRDPTAARSEEETNNTRRDEVDRNEDQSEFIGMYS